ncbi:MAG: toll/interleukin-1 receptor domain-containing protein [Haliscomenobacteraceae bacterium CHB4]|nr:hypothetical protein [Saprospiraceae bacterium]MCE7922136.1 toll/interleukin-1 receptor domain-containing protein [Haliscomenobacteraceae bacterium CHB4]
MKKESNPVKVFISYSTRDQEYVNELLLHLKPLEQKKKYLEIYHDGELLPGSEWDAEVRKQLATSQVVLFILSPDFVQSKYLNEVETRMALDMNRRGEAIIVPVLVRPTDFSSLPFNRFQAIPKEEGPVSTSKNREKTWEQVIKELTPLIDLIHDGSIEIRQRPKEEKPRNPDAFSKEISEARQQLKSGNIEDAVETLIKIGKATDPEIYRRAVWIYSRYDNLENNNREGLFSPSEMLYQRNHFTHMLMNLINDLNAPDRYGQTT